MGQTLKKITEDHYVIVENSRIKNGDWYLGKDNKPHLADHEGLASLASDVNLKKITHSTQHDKGMENVSFISPREVKELLGVVINIGKRADNYANEIQSGQYEYYEAGQICGRREGYEQGYNECLEDNKDKKYTEEDVIRIVEKSRETGLTAEYLMMTFQPKTEWEVEFTNGKLKLV